jgi:translation initiation factor IF-1
MPETPITTIGIVHGPVSPTAYDVELPNGKRIAGHIPKRLAALKDQLTAGTRVDLEMTPYDFEKARIVGITADA